MFLGCSLLVPSLPPPPSPPLPLALPPRLQPPTFTPAYSQRLQYIDTGRLLQVTRIPSRPSIPAGTPCRAGRPPRSPGRPFRPEPSSSSSLFSSSSSQSKSRQKLPRTRTTTRRIQKTSIAPPAALGVKAPVMAVESKPLFHPEVMRQQVRAFNLSEQVADWQPKLQHWAKLISAGRGDARAGSRLGIPAYTATWRQPRKL
jgi:hypothetical protein